MYGTIARLRVKEGREADLLSHLDQYRTGGLAPGFVASAVYRADAGGHWLAVVFESEEAYKANADSPEQNARYQEFRALLDADPEWHDGNVVQRLTS